MGGFFFEGFLVEDFSPLGVVALDDLSEVAALSDLSPDDVAGALSAWAKPERERNNANTHTNAVIFFMTILIDWGYGWHILCRALRL